MATSKTRLQRARKLAPRFARITSLLMTTEVLVHKYFERIGDEIEDFNEDLELVTTPTETSRAPSAKTEAPAAAVVHRKARKSPATKAKASKKAKA